MHGSTIPSPGLRRARGGTLVSVGLILSLSLVGCPGDTTAGLGLLGPGQLFAHVSLSTHAITMALVAPYDTLQLAATPQSALGTLLTDTSHTTYVSQDTSSLKVSATGLLTAVAPNPGIVVYAYRTIGGVTQQDSAIVNINDVAPPPVFTTLVPSTLPGDSARVDISRSKYVPGYGTWAVFMASALDAQGDTIPNVVMSYTTSNPTIVQINYLQNTVYAGIVIPQAQSVGQAVLTAEATIYGKHLSTSIVYTVGWPLVEHIQLNFTVKAAGTNIQAYFTDPDDTIAIGGVVTWDNPTAIPVGVVFDDSTQVLGFTSKLYDIEDDSGNVLSTVYDTLNGNIPAFKKDSVYEWYNPCGTYITAGPFGQQYQQCAYAAVYEVYQNRSRQFPVAGTYRYHSTLYGASGVIHVLPPFQVPPLSASQ